MNILAHIYLSDGTPESVVGNTVADFVKGPDVARLPAAVRAGVRLHRLVDGFTDRHPVVQRSITRVSGRWGWFAGILIDVYYDHVLARSWPAFSAEPLRRFADRAYAALLDFAPAVPAEARSFVEHFAADDRLVRYATADGIEDTLAKLSYRIALRLPKRAVRLDLAMPDLVAADVALEADFHTFFPQLVAFARGPHPPAGEPGCCLPAAVPAS